MSTFAAKWPIRGLDKIANLINSNGLIILHTSTIGKLVRICRIRITLQKKLLRVFVFIMRIQQLSHRMPFIVQTTAIYFGLICKDRDVGKTIYNVPLKYHFGAFVDRNLH